MSSTHSRTSAAYTALGLLSVLFWSTTVAFSRHLTEHFGTLTAAAGVYLVGGATGLIQMLARRGAFRDAIRMPAKYLLGCGGLFVLYTIMLYGAIGWSASGRQTVEVGLVNYLWPSMTILLSIPLLGRRARWTLLPGMAIALAGVVLAVAARGELSAAGLLANLRANPLPYAFAFVGAVVWGGYSNLSRRWASRAAGNGVPLFILAAGLTLCALKLIAGEPTKNALHVDRYLAFLIYMGLCPGLLGYLFYDLAVRRGHIIMVASLSYFIPLLSTLISCLFLGVPMRATLWLASAMLIAGAWTCRRATHKPPAPAATDAATMGTPEANEHRWEPHA
ncbi:MAG: aromatic amino acid DMT transporter YddG [Phycisphaerae bacterium]|nr:aromatic amino acid DMT transporter YddG [Phycisphaerae bacterium]